MLHKAKQFIFDIIYYTASDTRGSTVLPYIGADIFKNTHIQNVSIRIIVY